MILSNYKKALRVIESCTSIDHINPSKQYINNFFKLHTTPSRKMYGPFKTVNADVFVGNMYSRLLEKLEEKEKSLKKD